jgi:glycosyltransferase involved in cell wall biosynthesis
MLNLISIIVPCYNQAQYLNECLQSVIEQTYQNWECIIVNDGSPDNTEEITNKWVEKDNRFKYLYKDNGGLSSARNAGINIAQGIYILPLDADDKISNNFLNECFKSIEKNTNVNLIHGKLVKFGSINRIYKNEKYSYQKLLLDNLFPCSSLFKKSEAIDIGLYDENLKAGLEDWDFWIRLLSEKSNVVYLDNCSFFYRIKDNSMYDVLKKNNLEILKIKQYIFSKNIEKFNPKSQLELYFENLNYEKKVNNFEKYLSYKKILIILFEKIKNSIKFRLS